MSGPLDYYRSNARAFFDATVGVDMSELYRRFLAAIPPGGFILDAGCGSGRDARAFRERGFRVSAFDACPELAALAAAHADVPVEVRTFANVDEQQRYDGVWACASLLHVPREHLPDVLNRLWRALRPGGAFYLSFRLGAGDRLADGRHFTDAGEAAIRAWFAHLPHVAALDCWVSDDLRPGRSDRWINALVLQEAAAPERLVTGGANPFLPHLREEIAQASEIAFAVSFVKTAGLRLLLPDLEDALTRRKARLRILTSDYLDVTDPEALRLLLLLAQGGAEVRVHQAAHGAFHLKAYLFLRYAEGAALSGSAFIGSSNITTPALRDGLEWNYRVDFPGEPGFWEAYSRFEELFRGPQTAPLSEEWIHAYEARRVPPERSIAPGSLELEPPPRPTFVQREALEALAASRAEGFRRGLVVMATGLGKTWLAAFDAAAFGARRVLFVAHREEILYQAAETFLRIRPGVSAGFLQGGRRDVDVDVLCASVQTLARAPHLERFPAGHFDYIVVDEFHHAAANTYRRLLAHFDPRFLLGLTATPGRTDRADILSLCDDNLVYSFDLLQGVSGGLLAPFHYYGIYDADVQYQEIPWRNGRFDPQELENRVATAARADHALREWRETAQTRTLAFCVSKRHAEFMADYFRAAGVRAAAVHGDSELTRNRALEQLRSGSLEVLFSVDLFNEGVDLPLIDTVLLLRPTESKILFLQQLGRGLRLAEGKSRLVALDFVGNHRAFLYKPEALFGAGVTYRELAAFASDVELQRLSLPEGCFVNYDLQLIDFLKSLDSSEIEEEYEALKSVLGRRPTLLEFYRGGAAVQKLRQRHGSWAAFLGERGDLEGVLTAAQLGFLRELETTPMTKSYKMVLLEAFQELDGWRNAPSVGTLAARSWDILQRRRPLLADLPEELVALRDGQGIDWVRYWRDNPVNAWIGGNLRGGPAFFRIAEGRFISSVPVDPAGSELFFALVQEIVDFRLASYEARQRSADSEPAVVSIDRSERRNLVRLPYYPNLRVACGHFRTGEHETSEFRRLDPSYGRLDPARHFIVRAVGHSMDGGKNPIRDGDYLLMERMGPSSAGSISGNLIAIERQDASGDDQYLLRHVVKGPGGQYLLRANNPAYGDLAATEDFVTRARFRAVIPAIEVMVGQSLFREEIPTLFGETFNPGSWNSGHVTLERQRVSVLLVTLSKRGRVQDHRYVDHWVDARTFHWQSQNQTTPSDKRGREIIRHQELGISIHLFVREEKLAAGKSAPFVYHGPVDYRSHQGSAPMSVIFDLRYPREEQP